MYHQTQYIDQNRFGHLYVWILFCSVLLQIKDSLGSRLATEDKDQLETLMSKMDQEHQQELEDMHLQHVVGWLFFMKH